MVPCRASVEYEKAVNHGPPHGSSSSIGGGLKRVKKNRPCGCASRTFFRVEYATLHPYRSREAKFSDIYGFCADHEKAFADVKLYNTQNRWGRSAFVYGLRGVVREVTLITDPGFNPEKDVKEDGQRKLAAGFKATIKKMMGQRNSRSLTLEDWKLAFDECLDEFVVEVVMDS